MEELKRPDAFAFALIQGLAQGHASATHRRPVPLCEMHREALEASCAQLRTLERVYLALETAALEAAALTSRGSAAGN